MNLIWKLLGWKGKASKRENIYQNTSILFLDKILQIIANIQFSS